MSDAHPLEDRFGSAKHPERAPARTRPDGASDAQVEALGKLSEALEIVEQARGMLYGFHRMSGMADLTLQDAVGKLRAAGANALADDIETTLVGRDLFAGRWTFEIVEEYDANYWSVFRAADEQARRQLGFADKHVFEAEMKHDEQQPG